MFIPTPLPNALAPDTDGIHSLTAILVSCFLINLQEANLRSVKVDSDDPLHISMHMNSSLPSFVAANVAGEAVVSVEAVEDGRDYGGDM